GCRSTWSGRRTRTSNSSSAASTSSSSARNRRGHPHPTLLPLGGRRVRDLNVDLAPLDSPFVGERSATSLSASAPLDLPVAGRSIVGRARRRQTMVPILTIGQVAETTGVPPKTIRYYEAIGLVPPAPRTTTGYRQYDESAVDRLRFIRRARCD